MLSFVYKKKTIYAPVQMAFASGEQYLWEQQIQEEDFSLSTYLLIFYFKSMTESSAKNKC